MSTIVEYLKYLVLYYNVFVYLAKFTLIDTAIPRRRRERGGGGECRAGAGDVFMRAAIKRTPTPTHANVGCFYILDPLHLCE